MKMRYQPRLTDQTVLRMRTCQVTMHLVVVDEDGAEKEVTVDMALAGDPGTEVVCEVFDSWEPEDDALPAAGADEAREASTQGLRAGDQAVPGGGPVIASAPYYWVVCDVCGVSAQEGSDYSAWSDRDTCEIEPGEMDWHIEGGNHVCPDCLPGDREDLEEEMAL